MPEGEFISRDVTQPALLKPQSLAHGSVFQQILVCDLKSVITFALSLLYCQNHSTSFLRGQFLRSPVHKPQHILSHIPTLWMPAAYSVLRTQLLCTEYAQQVSTHRVTNLVNQRSPLNHQPTFNMEAGRVTNPHARSRRSWRNGLNRVEPSLPRGRERTLHR